MSNLIHAYAKRGLDLRISVETDEAHTDFSAIVFRIGVDEVAVTGLTAVDTVDGFTVDITLTVADLTMDTGRRTWELLATFGGEVRTLETGPFMLGLEPTS